MAISYCRNAWTGRHDSLRAIIAIIYEGDILSRIFLFPESSVCISLRVLRINYVVIWFSRVNKIVNGL